MEVSFVSRSSNLGIMDEEEEEEEENLGSLSSFSEEDEDSSNNSLASSSSELTEDATSSNSSSLASFPPSSSANEMAEEEGSLFEMASLVSELPIKRGLSKHYQGKSQSFTSLSSVMSLEDLIKPERPFKKKLLKSSKSYAGGLDNHKPLSPKFGSKAITKKASRSSFSSLGGRRHSFMSSKPPVPPQRSGSLSSQNLLFA